MNVNVPGTPVRNLKPCSNSAKYTIHVGLPIAIVITLLNLMLAGSMGLVFGSIVGIALLVVELLVYIISLINYNNNKYVLHLAGRLEDKLLKVTRAINKLDHYRSGDETIH